MALALTTAALSGVAAPTSTAMAESWQTCTYRTGPSWVGYTWEQGATQGRLPGHAYVAFVHRPNAWIEGGPYQYWTAEGSYDLHLVSSWPWGYSQAFNLMCYR